MAEKKFDKDTLRKYLFEKNSYIPKEAMGLLAQLLYNELNKYCEECEDDRMTCVLAPMCPERVLLKVRLNSGGQLGDLPQFCYQQYKNNVKRHLEKRTTLYKPIDNILFIEDFFEIFFHKISNKLKKAYLKKDIALIDLTIEESDLPEVKINFPLEDSLIFRKIIQRDKLIKKGTFVYYIDDSRRYMVIWYDSELFVVDFKMGKAVCNAKYDPITDLKLASIVFNMYCAEKNVMGSTETNPEREDELSLTIKIPFSQIYPDKISEDSNDFHELIEFLQSYFFKIKVEHQEKPDNNFVVSLQYSNSPLVQERKGLLRLNYDSLHQLINQIDKLKKYEEE